jgi:hypothetical protein
MNWGTINVEDDDLTGGADIFSDFNEGLENSQVMEDERYYRYGRFFTASFGIGVTSFTGNRGIAYEDETPSYNLSVHQFLDFNSAYGMGVEYSKHHFFVDEPVKSFEKPPGLIEVSMLRFFFDIRHYIDTTDLGTAITFSNPYFVGRIEYWYQTNKYIQQSNLGNDSGGGLGFGAGIGLEFPIELRESFIGVEFLLHKVNFFDKYTQNYKPVPSNPNGFGYEDLTGYAYSTMVSYVANW